MPCCVFRCPGGPKLVRFPAVPALRERWLEAIRAGTGTRIPSDLLQGKTLELCVSHFAKDPTECGDEYQEPSRFVNRSGKPLKIGSCRLCHRFGPQREMISLQGKVAADFRIDVILQQQSILKVELKASDFLQQICQECLVRVELIKSIQREFYYKNATFKTLQKSLTSLEVVQSRETRRKPPQPIIDCDLLDEDSIVGFTIDKTNPLQQTWNVPELQPSPSNLIVKPKKQPREPPPNQRTSKCYICRLQFHGREDLIYHLEQSHVAKPRYGCSECSSKTARFKEITAYNVHLSWHDEGERPLKCRKCPLRFVTKRGRLDHERRVHLRRSKGKAGVLKGRIAAKKVLATSGSRRAKVVKS
ncbi:uncharacterized protein LOC6044776 [Culex quinquefasciatus]|uniref:uncharacterized protein LOC6044776 n=1 Tax=Culex quinquefasciatus TaxID=7176 RepID=UPI0018E39383|nr:uncharacterized protein LOC6044776 [Culex quinquefasciatus]